MKNIFGLTLLSSVLLLNACSHSRHPDSIWYDRNDPGYEFAPAMYHSWPYEPLTQVTDKNATSWHQNSNPYNDYKGESNMNEMKPVEGTIARGKMDVYYQYPNNEEGYQAAGKELKNPIELDDYNLNEGRRLYNLYCDHCHGEKGDGNGILVKEKKYPPMGAYYDKLSDRPEGMIYHVITYGKGVMGSHASQLSPTQRWLITHWVQVMQKGENGSQARTMEDVKALTPMVEAQAEVVQDTTTEASAPADTTLNQNIVE